MAGREEGAILSTKYYALIGGKEERDRGKTTNLHAAGNQVLGEVVKLGSIRDNGKDVSTVDGLVADLVVELSTGRIGKRSVDGRAGEDSSVLRSANVRGKTTVYSELFSVTVGNGDTVLTEGLVELGIEYDRPGKEEKSCSDEEWKLDEALQPFTSRPRQRETRRSAAFRS